MFWAREDLGKTSAFLGYLASDEFEMTRPIIEWIKAEQKPFLVTVLCSATHDPYVVPEWFGTPAKGSLARYRQAISYTDKFIGELDARLKKLGLREKTIFCVIGDHGEAFGEHGLHGHERIVFEEVLRVPWVMRAPDVIEAGLKIKKPVSSVDLTPTLLSLLGYEISDADFDGANVLGVLREDRKIYFSCWNQQGQTGFVQNCHKFIYDPTTKMLSVYDLRNDPYELSRIEMTRSEAPTIVDTITGWRKNTLFQLSQAPRGKKVLFENWHCRWNKRISWAKYRQDRSN
jgi:arylsulfatase A-like enzyme